ncbi:MAG: hypothetical protein F6K11_15495 [Leptolyngbya sp. SIO3F4]|nr:hypothetical protein [Leptolyngbya sp. SIO3F4]
MVKNWLLGLSVLAMLGLTYQAKANLSAEPASSITLVTNEDEMPRILRRKQFEDYRQVIERTRSMIHDPSSQTLADRWGLDILDVTWEDTGRYDNSAVGPNISDMTIQVQQKDPVSGEYSLHLMPVIRYPNFADLTGDVPIDQFYVLTGNENGTDLGRVSLKDVLGDLRNYLSEPDSWQGTEKSLLAARDSHVLVSAQAAFLPIPQGDEAKFNPVLFNYQSYPGDPAVLTLLVTREGTSATVIDNQRDGFDAGRTWGQRLFFNQNGERASFTGQRLSDFELENDHSVTELSVTEPAVDAAGKKAGLNMVMLIQVPLKQKQPFLPASPIALTADAMPMEESEISTLRRRSDVEAAVIGHGEVEGPFTEVDNLEIERDPDFPIRVTVQFYKATSNGVVSADDMREIHEQIQKVYDDADYVGSLVLDGRQGRPTDYDGNHTEPDDWWEQFWEHSRDRLDMSEEESRELWERLRKE